jgi:hypothetical protein
MRTAKNGDVELIRLRAARPCFIVRDQRRDYRQRFMISNRAAHNGNYRF